MRPLQDELRIVNKGRTIAPLHNLITHIKTKTERYARHFCISRYEKFDWLAGYKKANGLYFWLCLHFSDNHEGLLGFKSFAKCAATVKIIWETTKG